MKLTIERLQEGYVVELGETETMPGVRRRARADEVAAACEVLKWLEYGAAKIDAVRELLKHMPDVAEKGRG